MAPDTGMLTVPRRPELPSPIVLGMIIFIASEMMFFGGLFAAYYTLRGIAATWPPSGVGSIFDRTALTQAWIASLVLWGSSLPAHLATISMRRRRFAAMRRWLLVTIVLGAIFMIWKFSEWSASPFSISSHAYGTMFFAMTGFHALHLVVGLVLLAGVVARISQGAYRNGDYSGPEAVVYYWHFVDAVWVAVFATIYLVR